MTDAPDNETTNEKIEGTEIHEQRTYRTRDNQFVVRKKSTYNRPWYFYQSDASGHMNGDVMRRIREESRRIYDIDGNFGLFFNLESSATFQKMVSDPDINIADYMLPECELSLYPVLEYVRAETDIRQKEHEIEEKMVEFQKAVSGIISRSNKYNKMEMNEISGSIDILADAKVQKIVSDESFLVQQNRDLYNEFLHVACSYVPEKSEIASNVTLSWGYDLNDALYNFNHNYYKDCIDMEKLGRVTGKLINCIQIHYKLEKGRTLQKELLSFSRRFKETALKKRKAEISQAWKDFPGFDERRILREDILNQIYTSYKQKTNWRNIKIEFEQSKQKKNTERNHGIDGKEFLSEEDVVYGSESDEENADKSWADQLENTTPTKDEFERYFEKNIRLYKELSIPEGAKLQNERQFETMITNIELNIKIDTNTFSRQIIATFKHDLNLDIPSEEVNNMLRVMAYGMFRKFTKYDLKPQNGATLGAVRNRYFQVKQDIRNMIYEDMRRQKYKGQHLLLDDEFARVYTNPYLI